MGRRAIKGAYGDTIHQETHGIPDDQLVSGGAYGKHRGVTRQRVKASFDQGLINRYLNSQGQPTYHPPTCDRQWAEQAEPSTVSVATTGQRARGMSGAEAMEMAGDFTPTPAPGEEGEEPQPGAIPQEGPPAQPEKKTKKADLVYGQARTKGMIHKAQLDELKVLQQRGVLVNRRGLAAPISDAAATTRDRIMVIPDFLAADLYDLAKDSEDRHLGIHAVRQELRRALADALVAISEEGIERLL